MRIGIYAGHIGTQAGGIETYMKNIIKEIGLIDQSNEYMIYLSNQNWVDNVPRYPNFSFRVLKPSSRWIQVPVSLPLALYTDSIDLFHELFALPPICPCQAIVTIHDVSPKTHPQFFPKLLRYRLAKLLDVSVRKAQRLIANSQTTKEEIMRVYQVPSEKIVVTHLAIEPSYKVLDPRAYKKIFSKYSIPSDFILYVGKIWSRKNLCTLIKSFYMLKKERRIPHKLLLVGKKVWFSEEVTETIKDLKMEEEIPLLGHVPDEDLALFYNAAALFVFPSLYEGFGLPPLEAMACGTPVVASNVHSIPEVTGEAALLVDPYDTEGLAEAIYRALNDSALRERLIREGLKRAQRFTWRESVEKLLTVYQDVLNQEVRQQVPN